ncbi:3-keto-steroid reductase [Gossypium arboreum]|uniref:3-keto-steroid reductase n=1 Tax=Gossypium arboreum TaxID=29729 RepID=A0A0B0NTJ9_GOSAR|nr:3-keto-steroid reductase [Gossypium arboreum]
MPYLYTKYTKVMISNNINIIFQTSLYMPYLQIHKFKSTNRKLDSVMCNSDLSGTSELTNLYKTLKKKQSKL